MPALEVSPELRTAFREATGRTQVEEWNARNPLSRALDFNRFIPDSRRQDHRGVRPLSILVSRELRGESFPLDNLPTRDFLFKNGRLNQKGFSWTAVLDGERIDEEGRANLEYFGSVYLQRGAEKLLKITREGYHIITLPDSTGVDVRVALPAEGGRSANGVIAVWYPELTNQPVMHESPQGNFVWKNRY